MAAGQKRLVIAGGGIAALEALLALRDLVGDAVTIDLVTPAQNFVFTPMEVAAPFARGGAAQYPLADLVREHGASLHADAVAAVDPETRVVVTADGLRVHYDALLIAVGARPVNAVVGAVMFPGPGADASLREIMAELESGTASSLAFVVPDGVTWALPVYELALLTRAELERRGAGAAGIQIVTAENAPLAVFGHEASERVGELLSERGIGLQTGVSEAPSGVDRVVAIRGLAGPALPGLPTDADGFIPIDEHCRVEGIPSVYAVGDATTFPLKQGGIATQQADAAAEAIAAEFGLLADPQPFRPVLRGQLLTGGRPFYLRTEEDESQAARSPLWWPPVKVAGRHLAPYLAAKRHSGTSVSGSELVDRPPDAADAPEVEDVEALAAALAAVDVSWVTPTSLRPSSRS